MLDTTLDHTSKWMIKLHFECLSKALKAEYLKKYLHLCSKSITHDIQNIQAN